MPGLIVMLISMTQFGTPFKLSIDYTGGSVWEMAFEQDVVPADVRQIFVDAGYKDTSAQSVSGENTVLLRSKDLTVEEKAALAEAVTAKLGDFEERRFEAIGPTIGREVTRASGVAVAVASLAILAFIWYVTRSYGEDGGGYVVWA